MQVSNSQRDRGVMVDAPTGVPEMLKFKSKRVSNAIFKKQKVKDDILANADAREGTVLKARISSQNFVDPQSLRLCFKLSTSADAPVWKFNNDAGVNAIIRSLKVSSGSTQLENIQNYNLLMKILYSASVGNDWKATLGWVEGFGTSVGTGTTEYTVNCPDYRVMSATPVFFSLPLHAGLLSLNPRLIPNGILNLNLDIELAPNVEVRTSTAGTETYKLNSIYLLYDEYVVSEAYSAIFQQALLQGISFDYETYSNVQVALATANQVNTITTDSQKQLRSIFTVVRDSTDQDGKNATNLETIEGAKMVDYQYRIGSDLVPAYKVSNIQDAYNMTLDALNRANDKNDDYPLGFLKYSAGGRCFFLGVDCEKSKTSDSSYYSGIDTNALQLQFTMNLSGTGASSGQCGSTASANIANGANGFKVDHFFLHDRVLTVNASKQIVVDF